MKKCKGCNEDKELGEYNANKRCADGYLTFCKACNKLKRQQLKHVSPEIYQRRLDRCSKHKADNKEHMATLKAAWDEANREHLKEYNHNAYWSNPEAARERAIAYRKANPEKCRQLSRDYASAKSPVYMANKRRGHAKRRATKKNATPSWADYSAIKKIYDKAVRLELETGIKYHVDHIVPLLGKLVCGLHVESNLQVITADENSKKTNTFMV